MTALAPLIEIVARHATTDDIHDTAIPGLALLRSSQPTLRMQMLHRAALCLVIQGAKVVLLSEQAFTYDANTFLLVSVEVPLGGYVAEAGPERPYLCIRLNVSAALLAELALAIASSPAPREVTRTITEGPLHFSPVRQHLTEALLRLLRLLDAPADIPVMAPLIVREIHYRLLTEDGSGQIQRLCSPAGGGLRVARAVERIKSGFAQPLRIAQVARAAGMSASSLHAHFKQHTGFTPLQYQKQLRLLEARRLLLADAIGAASAGFQVGYESASQFSRDYRRLFGAAPAEDAQQIRAALKTRLAA